MAVNEATGNVYVVDHASSRVEMFSSEGDLESELKGPSATGTGTLTGGSRTIEATASSGAFTPGEEISGEGIPPGTTIEAVEPFGMLVISAPVGGTPANPVALSAKQQFEEPEAVAVDNSCQQHTPDPLPEPQCGEVDPSAGDVYIQDGFSRQAIDKFTAGGEYIGQITAASIKNPKMEAFGAFLAVAVDPRGQVWVAESHHQEGFVNPVQGVDNFSNTEPNLWEGFRRSPLESLGNVQIERGLAVDAAGDSYVRTDRNHVGEFGADGGLINPAVGGETASGVAFDGVAVEPATADVYIDNVDSVGRFGPSSDGGAPEVERFGKGDLPEGVCESEASCAGGIAVNSVRGQVYVADAAGEVLQFVLEEPSVPLVASTAASGVTDDSARLEAEVNPRSVAGEPATSYRFQYGVCSSPTACASSGFEASAPVPDGVLPASFEVETVSVLVQRLRAGTSYHFRLVAENAHGVAVGMEEKVFTTRGAGAFTLADSRQWQVVSPPDKHGAQILPIGLAWPIKAAADGTSMSYAASVPTESEPAGFEGRIQVLSMRAPEGWSSVDLAVPHTSATGVPSTGQEYLFFSEDLSLAALQPFGAFVACRSAEGVEQPCLSPAASEQTAFIRSDSVAPGEPCSSSCYTPLVTGCPPPDQECSPAVQGHANVPAGTVFGQTNPQGQSCPPAIACGPELLDATPDLAHALLVSLPPLTGDPVKGGLYEWSAGSPPAEQLRLVSVPAETEAGIPGEPGSGDGRVRHAISPDGSRVVWSSAEHLFLRLNATQPQSPITGGVCTVAADACTVQVDNGLSGLPRFQLASADVSHVFFTEDGDLYEYSPGHGLLRLTEGAGVQGLLSAASEDGSWVYFVANGVLGDGPEHGAVSGNCEDSAALPSHACNLYVLHGGAIHLVAVLSAADAPDWGGVGEASMSRLTVRSSPDGEWLAFMSQRSLTGYDNRDVSSGKRDEEVFLYHASTGGLVCASCDPSGARPRGSEYGVNGSDALQNLVLVGGEHVWPGTAWLAGNIPAWTPGGRTGVSPYQSRYLSDAGRLFYNSSTGLVPRDVNGGEDVYEFEPVGVGSCSGPGVSSGAVVFIASDDGCIALVSSGSSAQESAFLDASASGDDVFFLTTATLSGLDSDTAYDVYDAHVCGVVPCLPTAAVPPPRCDTEASCKAAPSLQPEIFGLSGSATFSGPGNATPAPAPSAKGKRAAQVRAQKLAKALRACKRLRTKRSRAACSRRAHRRYGPFAARKAERSPGAGR